MMFDLSMFPVSIEAAFTIAGATVICVILTQLLKHYLAEWRFTNLLAWGITLGFVEIAGVFLSAPGGLGKQLYIGALYALFGAALATFGYETIVNLLGKAGVGPRSSAAQLKVAEKMVMADDDALARVAKVAPYPPL